MPSQKHHRSAARCRGIGAAPERLVHQRWFRNSLLGLISSGLAILATSQSIHAQNYPQQTYPTQTYPQQQQPAGTSPYNRYMTPPGGNVYTAQPGTDPTQQPPYQRPQSAAGGTNFPPQQYAQPAAPSYTPPPPVNSNGANGYGANGYGANGYGANGYGPGANVGGTYQGGAINQANAPFTTTQSGGVQLNGGSALPAPGIPTPPPIASGYGAPGTYVPTTVPEYQVAPGVTGSIDPQGGNYAALAPGAVPPGGIPGEPTLDFSTPTPYQPRVREAPVVIYAQEARTGRIILGGSVNSDLGVAGQVIVDERNFDWRRFPTSWGDLFGGRAFRGAGQNFRAELMPGTNVQRYTLNFTQPHLFGYSRVGFGVGGFLFTRQFRDWTEQRLGGRLALSYDINQSLSVTTELQMQDVEISNPRLNAPELNRVLGSNDLYTGRIRVAHDTRDNVFMATEGHLIELIYDQNFGEFDYPRGQINLSRYFLIRERADGGGRHTWRPHGKPVSPVPIRLCLKTSLSVVTAHYVDSRSAVRVPRRATCRSVVRRWSSAASSISFRLQRMTCCEACSSSTMVPSRRI